MSSDFSPELKRELFDDFYAECDELIIGIRAALSKLEQVAEQKRAAPELVETVYRFLHSLKGGAAIIGLRAAEELAHGMEDLVRRLSRLEVAMTVTMIDLLLAAVQRFEQVVSAHRLQNPLPDIADLLARLDRSTAQATKNPAAQSPKADFPLEGKIDPVQSARERGLHPWLFSFTPSADLDRRGVNVKSVRERLSRIGDILAATPIVREKGSILFEFTIGVREDPTEFASWEQDGITVAPIAESPPTVKSIAPIAEAEADPRDAKSLTPSHIVRVDLARLDELLRITGEMVICRSRLDEWSSRGGNQDGGLREINLAFARSLREMREAVSRVRMVPVGEIFTRMPFVVRDLGRESDKKARVTLEGDQTEIDKFLVERLKEPLLHLVRNAFAHGIEPSTERRQLGKATEATILLRATTVGDSVLIEVRDDGRGIDPQAIARRAKTLGLTVPEIMDEAAVLAILCLPGFSTRDQADLAAGRGVGMAVVAETVRELGGTLSLETWSGSGTQFTLRLPLTLAITDAIIVSAGEQSCAVPQGSVVTIVQAAAGSAVTISNTEAIPYQDGLLPFVRLRKLFGIGAADAADMLTILVVRSERGLTGLAVDRVQTQREIVMRPLSDPLLRVPGISGATELGDGRPILILDPIAITKGAARPFSRSATSAPGISPLSAS